MPPERRNNPRPLGSSSTGGTGGAGETAQENNIPRSFTRWTSAELKRLCELKAQKVKWKDISHEFGRSEIGCKRAFDRVDDRDRRVRFWTQKDDAKLLKLRGQGLGWPEISMQLLTRTPAACKFRHWALSRVFWPGMEIDSKQDGAGEGFRGRSE